MKKRPLRQGRALPHIGAAKPRPGHGGKAAHPSRRHGPGRVIFPL